MRKVIILSGPSGCGKSTWAKKYLEWNAVTICSADDHFVNKETGEYKFDPTQIAIAHSICFSNFLDEMRMSEGDVIIDNTNISYWERRNYIDAAQIIANARGESIDIVTHNWQVETVREIWICAKRNSHGVPAEVVAKMAMNHEISPGIMHKIEE